MNVDKLIRQYFSDISDSPIIEVFDDRNIYNVYTDIVNLLNSYPEIELSVLQGFSYCFYEILDNVLTHSDKLCGTVVMKYNASKNVIQILVADDGIGIHKSLSMNLEYAEISEADAVRLCINDKVTDGKGMGFGLYSTCRLIENAGVVIEISSGNSAMIYNGNDVVMEQRNYWQGTIVYFEIHSNKEINPNEIVEFRTDCEAEFNDVFNECNDLENLW